MQTRLITARRSAVCGQLAGVEGAPEQALWDAKVEALGPILRACGWRCWLSIQGQTFWYIRIVPTQQE
jgi:hypothetical protein